MPDTVASGTAVGSLTGGPGVHEVTLEYPDDATHIMVSIESAAGARTPSNAQILWAAGLQGAGVAKSLSLGFSFGNLIEDRTWSISGSATGGVFGEEYRQLYRQLPRPPVGYKYVAWLAPAEGAPTRLPDETFTSPPPMYEPLESADTDLTISAEVQPLTILRAFTKISAEEPPEGQAACAGCYDLRNFETFYLTLEPRAGITAEPSPTTALEGLVPKRQ